MRPGSAFCSTSPRASSGGQSVETGDPLEGQALCRVTTKSWTKNSSGLLGPRKKHPLLGRLVFLGRPRDPPLQTLQSHASAGSVQSLGEKILAHFMYRRVSRPRLSHPCAHCEMHRPAQARAIFKKDVIRHGCLTRLGPERPARLSSTRRRGDEEEEAASGLYHSGLFPVPQGWGGLLKDLGRSREGAKPSEKRRNAQGRSATLALDTGPCSLFTAA